MWALEHRVRVFVFQVLEEGTEFLLLRLKPRTEWLLGPVVGSVEPAEKMLATVLREVRVETGLCNPLHVFDLNSPQKEVFGDVGLVEWPFAFQAGAPHCPAQEPVPGPTVGELAWMGFEEAWHTLDSEADRHSLLELRLALGR